MIANAVSVTTSATLLASGSGGIGDAKLVSIKSTDNLFFVGGSDVDSTDGFELAADVILSLTLKEGDDLYGITGTGTAAVCVLETGRG